MIQSDNQKFFKKAEKGSIVCLFLFTCLYLGGCALSPTGTAGDGIYSYMNGALSRAYQVRYNKALTACIRALEKQDLKITENRQMALYTVIKSEYFNGKPVTVIVKRSGSNITEISVRSGITGLWDKKFSEQIHAAIAQEFQQ